jgi:hypothetical protein
MSSTQVSIQTSREALLHALTFADLAEGKGNEKQQLAYRELEWRRCKADYEYFRTHYCYIILKSGDIIRWDTPYPMQVESAEEWRNGDSTIEVKSRQLGETTNGTHFALWECMFRDAVVWNFFGADEDASKDMKRRLDATLDRLPKWMLERARMTKTEEDTKKRQKEQNAATIMSFGLSKILIYSGSVRKAQGLTGKTLFDDAGKHSDPERKWQLLYPTIDDPDPKNRGQVIVIFNGNGEDFLFHLYQRAKEGKVALKAHFYNWRDDPRRLWALDEDTGEGARCDLKTRKEIYPWYEHAKSQYLIDNPDLDEMAFKAQYPETEDEAFYISSNSRFDPRKLSGFDLVVKELPPAKVGYLELVGNDLHWKTNGVLGRFRLYEKPVAGASYIIGVDTAGGHADSDDSVMQVTRIYQHNREEIRQVLERLGYAHPPTIDGLPSFEFVDTLAILEQVCVYQAKSEPMMQAYQAKRLGEWYNDALVVVEANNHGHTLLEHLKDDYWNLYREERKEKSSDEETERLGFWTGHASKEPLIDNLAGWLHNAWFLLRDKATIQQLRTYGYQVSASGAVKLGAPKGMNDDLVIGAALCVIGARSLVVERSKNPVRVLMPWEI